MSLWPGPVAPMLPVGAAEPFDSTSHSFELKWDGIRCLAFVERAGPTRLQSRNLRDITARHSPLATMAGLLRAADRAVLDGEIIAFAAGRPSFQAALRGSGSKVFVAFDLLHLDGRDLTDLSLEERQGQLAQAIAPSESVVISSGIVGPGREIYDAAAREGLEGIVAKRLGSRYQPGRRSPDWLKVVLRLTADLAVLGVTAGGIPCHHPLTPAGFGSVVVGQPVGSGTWVYLGNVGTGWSARSLTELLAALEPDEQPPFVRAGGPPRAIIHATRWVKPAMVVEVAYREVTPGGVLRHPSFRRVRPELAAESASLRPPVRRDGGVDH